VISNHRGQFQAKANLDVQVANGKFGDPVLLVLATFDQNLDPDGVSRIIRWTAGRNGVNWSPNGGRKGGGAVGIPGLGNATLGIELELKECETIFISRDVKRNFLVTDPVRHNFKSFRAWHRQVGNRATNLYVGVNNARVFTEFGPVPNGYWYDRMRSILTSLDWVTERLIITGGARNKNSGRLELYRGVQRIAAGPVLTDVDGKRLDRLFPAHEVAANKGAWGNAWKRDSHSRVDNVIVARGRGHFLATDNAVLANSRKVQVLPVVGVRAGGWVTLLIPDAGVFARGEQVYLHAMDESGRETARGYHLGAAR
jgi:hypothetical protein